MKEKVKIGKLAKGILLVFQQMMIILCVVSVTLFAVNTATPIAVPYSVNNLSESHVSYLRIGYNSVVDIFNPQKAFEDTSNFGEMMICNVADIIRYCVIREQLETNGKFDGKKVIHISQYANHIENPNGTESTSDASYYLEDLISWSQYGWETEEIAEQEFINMMGYMVADYLPNETITVEDVTEHNYMAEVPEESVTEHTYTLNEITDSFVPVDESDEVLNYITVPVERYLTVAKEPLAVYVDNTEDYLKSVEELKTTIDMLAINYREYQNYQKYFDEQNKAFQYYVTVGEGKEQRVYTNLPKELQESNRRNTFMSLGKYLYYEPTTSTFESNIESIVSEDIRGSWQQYTYAFSEPCSIWVGVDTTYPYEDNYAALANGYAFRMHENAYLAKLAVASGIFAFLLLVVLTVFAGRKKKVDNVVLTRFDHISTEIALMISGIAMVLVLLLFAGEMQMIDEMEFRYSRAQNTALVEEQMLVAGIFSGVWALVANSMFLFLYFSFVRRMKAHTLFSNSLIVRGFRKLKLSALDFYTHGSVAVKTIVPVMIAGLLNIVLAALGVLLLDSWLVIFGVLLFLFVLALDAVLGILLYEEAKKRQNIVEGIDKIKDGDLAYKVDTQGLYGENQKLALAVNSIGEGIQKAVEVSMKDERMKAELITNVSHDIKTPLTSIISYVDLLKRENIQDETVRGYIEVLDMKSQRLKQLTEDLVEASKISSGNITLDMKELNLVELLQQTAGEYEEKFRNKSIRLVMTLAEHPIKIIADSRRMWRIIENLYSNIYKYALEGTRAYVDVSQVEEKDCKWAVITIKNISAQPLNIAADELTERFIRGDISRSTEGSGLGLSIAKDLAEAQNGIFDIYLDGDLFKVTMRFPVI